MNPSTWNNGVVSPLRQFWKWYSTKAGLPDPTGVLVRRKQHPAQRSTRGLAKKLASLDPIYRSIARLMYLTGLEITQTFSLIEQRSPGTHAQVLGRGGKKTQDVYLEPDALAVLEELQERNLTREQKRNTQKKFKEAGLQARDIVIASRLHRGAIRSRVETVAPALAMLMGRPDLERVTSAYEAALRELRPGGSAADAITDAARALQEMLVGIGARGKSLGPLADDARKQSLFGPYDSKLAGAIEALVDWVNADRSTRGDAHVTTATLSDDAWLTVRVVGALLIRLSRV